MANNEKMDYKKYTNNRLVRILFYLFLIGMLVLPFLGLIVTIVS